MWPCTTTSKTAGYNKAMELDWIYVEDQVPPEKPAGQAPRLVLVSARRKGSPNYVAIAAYYLELGIWMDMELHPHDVYAWCIPSPARER